jgi:hypothetical protein
MHDLLCPHLVSRARLRLDLEPLSIILCLRFRFMTSVLLISSVKVTRLDPNGSVLC